MVDENRWLFDDEGETSDENDMMVDAWVERDIANSVGQSIKIVTTYGDMYEGMVCCLRDDGVFVKSSDSERHFCRLGAILSYTLWNESGVKKEVKKITKSK